MLIQQNLINQVLQPWKPFLIFFFFLEKWLTKEKYKDKRPSEEDHN